MTTGYVELPVRPELAERVVCTWIDASGPRSNPVLPDTCIDLVWDGRQVVVAGPDTRAWSSASDLTYVGIRFRPGAAPAFLDIPASDVVDRRVSLSELWGTAADELAEQLAEAGARAPQVLEAAVLQRLPHAAAADPLVTAVMRELRQQDELGSAVVERLGRSLDLSPRTLHRRSTAALGYGPKTLDRILRFRRALRLLRAHMRLADAALRAGYADQAHLTNEFRRLGGTTPRVLSGATYALASDQLAEVV